MKTIGLIGGMSWESSALYYRLINEETKRRLGGHHNAKSLMFTLDFAEIEYLQHTGEWDGLASILAAVSQGLQQGGADFIVLCTNTMHKVADSIRASVDIPLLHIVDATATAIQKANQRRVGLLATKFTMEQGFCLDRMRENFAIDVLVPPPASRQIVHDVIYKELCHGIVRQESRTRYQSIIRELKDRGAEAIILGCTEIELLISRQDAVLPVYPSTTIHAHAAVDFALQPEP